MADNGPETWDPSELVLYALEYLDMYILFAFKAEDSHESYPGLALSYLESTLECLQDAEAALRARYFAKPS